MLSPLPKIKYSSAGSGGGGLPNPMGLCPLLGDLNPLLRKGGFFHTYLWYLPDPPQSTPSTGIPTEKMGKYTTICQLKVLTPPPINTIHVPNRLCASGSAPPPHWVVLKGASQSS